MISNSDLDRSAIRSLLECYFVSIDRKDWDSVATCFSTDSVSFYNNDPSELVGPESVVRLIKNAIGTLEGTIHSIGSIEIDVDGDKAMSWTSAIAHLPYQDRQIVSIRAITYIDEFEKREGTWKIVRRKHQPLWQYEAEMKVPHLPMNTLT